MLHTVVIGALMGVWNRQLAETEETPIMVELVPPPETAAPEPVPQPKGDPNSEQPAEPQSELPVLQPVIEFAEADSAPRVDLDGRSENQTNRPELNEPQPAEADDVSNPDTELPEVSREQDVEVSEEQAQEAGEPASLPDQLAGAEAAPDASGATEQTISLIVPTPRPEQNPEAETVETAAAAGTPPQSNEAILDDPRLLTAMAGMPRSQRINLLCMTVMRNQLETARPPRPPQYLPAFDLPEGNVLHPPEAAFLSRGQWFELAFRCEVNDGATKVEKFSYRVGEAIPRSQWLQRGFPSF